MITLVLSALLASSPVHPRVREVYDAIDGATSSTELRTELRRVCARESRCNRDGRVAVHPGDAKLGRARWRRAVARGLIHPDRCPEHELGDDPSWWSTVGALGTTAAFVVRHLGPCVGPRALVDPRHAARAAVAHARVLCRFQGACTCPERAMWWAGPGRWQERSPLQQIHAVTRQCGAQPTFDWVLAYAELPVWHAERILEDLGELGVAIADRLHDLERETIAS